MVDAKLCNTPCLPYHLLLKEDGEPYSNPKVYRSIVGALQYLTFTSSDIAFSVHQVPSLCRILWCLILLQLNVFYDI
jgi:hypothetical protein